MIRFRMHHRMRGRLSPGAPKENRRGTNPGGIVQAQFWIVPES
jgi:hypothetical protein